MSTRVSHLLSPEQQITYLLPQLHDLEPLEVVQLPPLLERSALLGPGALVELLLDLVLLPLLRNVADTGGAGQLRDDDGGEGELGEGDFLTGDGGLLGGTINKDLCRSAAAFLPVHVAGLRTRLWSMISTMAARRPS